MIYINKKNDYKVSLDVDTLSKNAKSNFSLIQIELKPDTLKIITTDSFLFNPIGTYRTIIARSEKYGSFFVRVN